MTIYFCICLPQALGTVNTFSSCGNKQVSNISLVVARCHADAHALASQATSTASGLPLVTSSTFDTFHCVTLEFFLVNLDFITCPNTHCGLPNHDYIVFRYACCSPVFCLSWRPTKICGSRSVSWGPKYYTRRYSSLGRLTSVDKK